jgi:hypothetical protein|tara:strand:- start:2069 stop:2254 length:186 start_codon:yes stop_codon:yes gene_type:complete
VPSSTLSRDFDKDLKTADVPKWTPAGKLDFHAIRLAYINLVLDPTSVRGKRRPWRVTLRRI